jgi:hypothetical protein
MGLGTLGGAALGGLAGGGYLGTLGMGLGTNAALFGGPAGIIGGAILGSLFD